MCDLLPRDVAEKLREFMLDEETGKVTLHVHKGSVKAADITRTTKIFQDGARVER